jgi:hypothetical protein
MKGRESIGQALTGPATRSSRISGAAANVGGTWHRLDKLDQPAG